jgi:hypothetical protein
VEGELDKLRLLLQQGFFQKETNKKLSDTTLLKSGLRHKLHVYGPSSQAAVRRHFIAANHVAKLLNQQQKYRLMLVRVSDVDDPKTGYSATRIEFERDIIVLARHFHECFKAETEPMVKLHFGSKQPPVAMINLYHNPEAREVYAGSMEGFALRSRAFYHQSGFGAGRK